jgi:hypothetical protein
MNKIWEIKILYAKNMISPVLRRGVERKGREWRRGRGGDRYYFFFNLNFLGQTDRPPNRPIDRHCGS